MSFQKFFLSQKFFVCEYFICSFSVLTWDFFVVFVVVLYCLVVLLSGCGNKRQIYRQPKKNYISKYDYEINQLTTQNMLKNSWNRRDGRTDGHTKQAFQTRHHKMLTQTKKY